MNQASHVPRTSAQRHAQKPPRRGAKDAGHPQLTDPPVRNASMSQGPQLRDTHKSRLPRVTGRFGHQVVLPQLRSSPRFVPRPGFTCQQALEAVQPGVRLRDDLPSKNKSGPWLGRSCPMLHSFSSFTRPRDKDDAEATCSAEPSFESVVGARQTKSVGDAGWRSRHSSTTVPADR